MSPNVGVEVKLFRLIFIEFSIHAKSRSWSSESVEYLLSLYSLRLESRFALCLCVDQTKFLRRRSVFACPVHHKKYFKFQHAQRYLTNEIVGTSPRFKLTASWKTKNRSLPSSNWWTNTNPHGTDARLLIRPTKVDRKIKRRGKQQKLVVTMWKICWTVIEWLLTVEALAESPLCMWWSRDCHTGVRGVRNTFSFRILWPEKSRKTLCLLGPRCDYEILAFHVFLLFLLTFFRSQGEKKLRFFFSTTQNPAIFYSSIKFLLQESKKMISFSFAMIKIQSDNLWINLRHEFDF